MTKRTQTEHLDSTPVTPATAKKLLDHLGVTEAEAQAALEIESPTDDQLQQLQHVNLHAISAAFSASATDAMVTNPKLDLPTEATKITASADHIRFLVHVGDKFESLVQTINNAGRFDADSLQRVASSVVPQLKSRIRVSPALRETFAALLAYHHARYPGKHAHHADTPPTHS